MTPEQQQAIAKARARARLSTPEPAPVPEPVEEEAPIQTGVVSEFIDEAGRQGWTAPGLQIKLFERLAGEKFDPSKGTVGKFLADWWNQEKESLAPLFQNDFGKQFLKALRAGIEPLAQLQSDYPQEFAIAESALEMTAPVKLKGKVGTVPAKKVDTELMKEIVVPDMSRAKAAERMQRQGLTDEFMPQVKLSKAEQAITDEVAKVQGLDRWAPMKNNYAKIQRQSYKFGEEINDILRKSNKRFSRKDINLKTGKKFSETIGKPDFVDMNPKRKSKLAQNMSLKLNAVLKKYPNTAEGINKARQEFDRIHERIRGKQFVDQTKRETLELALYRGARNTLNELVDSVSPAAAKLRARQSNLISALDSYGTKAVRGAETAGEALQGVSQKLFDRSVQIRR